MRSSEMKSDGQGRQDVCQHLTGLGCWLDGEETGAEAGPGGPWGGWPEARALLFLALLGEAWGRLHTVGPETFLPADTCSLAHYLSLIHI